MVVWSTVCRHTLDIWDTAVHIVSVRNSIMYIYMFTTAINRRFDLTIEKLLHSKKCYFCGADLKTD